MKEIVRNLTRRKLRSFLTISGIVIGIVALTTMGALANNFNALLDGGAKYIAGFVPVGDASSNGLGGSGVAGEFGSGPRVARQPDAPAECHRRVAAGRRRSDTLAARFEIAVSRVRRR